MIRVPFTEPLENADWGKWRAKTDRATAAIVEKFVVGEAYRIREALYKEMRQVFLDAFHGKCAYCEAKIILDQRQGDVEHFRPKGSVTDERNRPVTLPPEGNGEPRPHPGYPWLAYDWRNLLPSCAACNRPGKTRDGKLVGKWERFPVGRFRALAPGDEARERPLLLHPVFDDPERHLGLRPKTGVIYGKTRRGRICVDVLDLNREGLPEARRKVYLETSAVAVACKTLGHSDMLEEWTTLLTGYKDGTQAYSWAGRLALESARRRGLG